MTAKWNTQKFSDYVLDLFGDEFKVLGEYVNNNTDILMYHEGCGREFFIRPGNFKTRKRCPLCFIKSKKTTKKFKKEIQELVGNKYSLLSEYNSAKTNVVMKHNECDHEYNVRPTDFLFGNRCPKCFGNMNKNTESFKEEVYKLTGDEYEIIGEYVNKRTPILFKHNVCGHEFHKMPELFLKGHGCSRCGLEKRSGKNHYKYNPDLTKEERLRRDMFNGKIRKWRDKIFVRDEYTCKLCNSKGGKLNAHHIKSWNSHKEDRFNLDNGITLCESCHKKFHSNYGYGNNTETQFKEFQASL